MGKRAHDISIDPTDNLQDAPGNYCGFRLVIIMSLIASVLIYTLGGIITGIAYYHFDKGSK